MQIHSEHQDISITVPSSISIELLSYATLLLLREEWIHIWSQEQGLEEDWKATKGELNHSIMHFPDELDCKIVHDYFAEKPLVFPDYPLADSFCNTFKPLLEEAKRLY